MKRIIALVIAVIMLVCVCGIHVYANARGGSCGDNHGPIVTSCSGMEYSLNRHHYFDYMGYTKRCDYLYVLAYTARKCGYCGQPLESTWSHSHGYRDHAADCGWINSPDGTCFFH